MGEGCTAVDSGRRPIVLDEAWVTSVTIDCADPQRLARFWADLLGLRVRPRESRYVALTRPATGTPELVFQPVPEEKTGKVRLHLDIGVHDLARAQRRAVELGASLADDLGDRDDDSLVVMRDPEGNEFCLIHRRAGDL
jgi:catechol 2,3-dioxygenase-like lactoylglutathione lyase family enzyme